MSDTHEERERLDPIIGFGRHSGTRLSSLDVLYLKWMAAQSPPISNRGANWTEISKNELQRRVDGQDFPRLLPTDESRRDVLVAEVMVEKKTKVYSVEPEALDDLSILLLKEFVLRKDKSQGIRGWAVMMAQEAVMYGEKALSTHHTVFYYVGFFFVFDLAELEYSLSRVKTSS